MSISTLTRVCPAAENGARLNYLYQQYQKAVESDTAVFYCENLLFAEVQNYAERLVTKFAKQENFGYQSLNPRSWGQVAAKQTPHPL